MVSWKETHFAPLSRSLPGRPPLLDRRSRLEIGKASLGAGEDDVAVALDGFGQKRNARLASSGWLRRGRRRRRRQRRRWWRGSGGEGFRDRRGSCIRRNSGLGNAARGAVGGHEYKSEECVEGGGVRVEFEDQLYGWNCE